MPDLFEAVTYAVTRSPSGAARPLTLNYPEHPNQRFPRGSLDGLRATRNLLWLKLQTCLTTVAKSESYTS
jgi:hypothetical protein